MSDYKRWISYIYFYENNVKKNNIGYIRVETRGGNTKLTMHINVLSVTEPMNVYLFVRSGGKIRGINIGVISMDKGVGHGVYNTETENIMNTGHCINDIGGVILFHERDKFYASEWDDSVIDIDKFAEFNQDGESESEDGISDDISIHQGKDMDEAREDEKKQRNRSFDVEDGLEKSTVEKADMGNTTNIHPDAGKMKNENMNIRATDSGCEENENMNNNVAYDENKDNVNTHNTFADSNGAETTDLDNAEMEDRTHVASESPAIEAMENRNDEIGGNNMAQEARDAGNNNMLSDEIVMAAENILHTYPYMYPFENDDIDACVRIEPQDISNLPIDTWLLSNNSFLLKGYYSYRHLIFLKIGKVNPRYMIGVPGINHNRENFLANMFGFKLFKPIKNTSDIRGEFGYWCISISGK